MLQDLKILNGNLDLKFDKYNYEYTVHVDEDVKKLDIDYIKEENAVVEVSNNTLNNKHSTVYITVKNGENVVVYTLYVTKNISENVSKIDEYIYSLETNTETINTYELQFLGIGVFFAIVIVFTLFFKKKRIK